MKKTMIIKVADLVIRVNTKYQTVVEKCADYIVSDDTPEDFTIEITDEEIEQVKQWKWENEKEIISDADAEYDYLYQKYGKVLPFFNAFLLHAVVLEMDGKAYAFSANSGVGKTTHARLWMNVFENRVRIIDGDNPIVRIIDGKAYVYGTPCCGKEGWNINTRVELGGIGFIVRDKINVVNSIPGYIAFLKTATLNAANITPQNQEKVFDLYQQLVNVVPFYEVHCNMDIEAAIVAKEAMCGGRK